MHDVALIQLTPIITAAPFVGDAGRVVCDQVPPDHSSAKLPIVDAMAYPVAMQKAVPAHETDWNTGG